MDMRRGGSLASGLGILILAHLGTFCSFAPADLEGSPIALPDRRNSPPPNTDTGTNNNQQNDPPPQQTGDSGTSNGGTNDAGDGGVNNTGPRTAFVSSQTVSGNIGGVNGADALCAQLATAAKVGSGGTWKAWISTAQVNAIDRMTSNGPWKTVTGTIIANAKTDLASGILKGALNKDEKGATPPLAEDRVWTATNQNGTYAGANDCGAWTGAGNGLVGEAEHGDGRWTALVAEACTEVNRVYCFEQ